MPQNRMHIRRGNLTEIDALYCDVLVALQFLLLLDSFVSFFAWGLCLFDTTQQALFLTCLH